MKYQARHTECFVISGNFLPFYPLNSPENQNFEKMKKTHGGIIISNMSIINENHMMFDSGDMEHDRQNSFSFWTIFCPFTPPREPKFWKKMKKITPDVLLFYNWHKCTINDNHMIYDPWHEVYQTEFICHLVQFFLLLPLPPEGVNFYFLFGAILFPLPP